MKKSDLSFVKINKLWFNTSNNIFSNVNTIANLDWHKSLDNENW